MKQHLRIGVAFALLLTSLAATATLILNTRFVDDLIIGLVVFLGVPILAGGALGALVGQLLARLANLGSSEAPVRAYELLWGTLAGFLCFFGTLAVFPPFLGIFSNSETIRYGGALVLSSAVAYGAALAIRHLAKRTPIWAWPLLVAVPSVVVLLGATEWGKGHGAASRVVVIALPGLSWDVAEELIEKDEMPHLDSLRRDGAWGPAATVKPSLSSAVWTSVATGRPCEEHGVMSIASSGNDIQTRRLWDIYAERGWSIGLFGWPLTWPPTSVDGFVVPAVSDMGTETHPKDLSFIRELAMHEKTGRKRSWGRYCRYAFQGIQHGARLGTLIAASGELLFDPLWGRNLDTVHLFNRRKLRARLNCDYFIEARRQHPVEFAAYFTNIVGVAQKYFWKYYEPSAFEGISPSDIARYGSSVQDSYRLVDDFLGRILEDTHENDLVVVVSDHGAVASNAGERRPLTLRVEPMLKHMRLKGVMEASNVGARTYLRMKSEYEGNPERVRRLFETARLDRGGIRAFQARVDDWDNVVVNVNPAVLSFMDDTLLFQGGRCDVAEVVRSVDYHESAGISDTGSLVMSGKGIRPGSQFTDASLLDLFPTLLVLTGMDLAADLSGDIIETALEPDLRNAIPGVIATYERDDSPLSDSTN